MAFLKRKQKLTLYFDPTQPRVNENMFNGSDKDQFKDHYRDAVEELHWKRNAPISIDRPSYGIVNDRILWNQAHSQVNLLP